MNLIETGDKDWGINDGVAKNSQQMRHKINPMIDNEMIVLDQY